MALFPEMYSFAYIRAFFPTSRSDLFNLLYILITHRTVFAIRSESADTAYYLSDRDLIIIMSISNQSLRKKLKTLTFNQIKSICVDLGLDYQDFEHQSSPELIVALINYANKRERVAELNQAVDDELQASFGQSIATPSRPQIEPSQWALIGLGFVLLSLVLYFLLSAWSQSSSSSDTFLYQVEVTDELSGEFITNASVTLAVENQAPYTSQTDSRGVAILSVSNRLLGTTGQLSVSKPGYEREALFISLAAEQRPTQIQLSPP